MCPRDSRKGHFSDPTTISTSLLQQVRSMDPEGWQRLVRLYGPGIYRWAEKSGLCAADAADVVQEVFVAVAQRIASLRRDRPKDTFSGWLRTVARNKIADRLRDLRLHPQAVGGTDHQQQLAEAPELPDAPLGDGDELADGLVHRVAEMIRAEFEPRTWQAFWRTAVDGQPAAEVAKELGMSKQAVYQAKYRVRRRLRQELDGPWSDESPESTPEEPQGP